MKITEESWTLLFAKMPTDQMNTNGDKKKNELSKEFDFSHRSSSLDKHHVVLDVTNHNTPCRARGFE